MGVKRPRIVLASASPRRRELLAEAGYDFVVVPPGDDAEGGARDQETVAQLVSRLARQKAADVAARLEIGLVVGCDTVVECQEQVLGKPKDVAHARQMLSLIRGRKHHVHSGLCLWDVLTGMCRVRVATTTLIMTAISDDQLDRYLRTDRWQGKAGAFGYQDGHDWLHIVRGSESNVVGLPLELLAEMMEGDESPETGLQRRDSGAERAETEDNARGLRRGGT